MHEQETVKLLLIGLVELVAHDAKKLSEWHGPFGYFNKSLSLWSTLSASLLDWNEFLSRDDALKGRVELGRVGKTSFEVNLLVSLAVGEINLFEEGGQRFKLEVVRFEITMDHLNE